MVSESRSIEDELPEVYQRLRRSMRRVLYEYRIPVQDAEDLIQTVLLLAVGKWSKIHSPGAWLLGTLQKSCILYWRASVQHRRRFAQLDGIAEPAVAPVQARWELLADLGAASRRLPAAQRRLVALRCQFGLTPPEAAAATGLAHGSVRTILNRGLARLREQLGEPPRRPRARAQRRGPRRVDPPPTPPGWSAAVDAWLGASSLKSKTCLHYRLHVTAAGGSLGRSPLAELATADLAGFRAALLEDGRAPGTHLCVLQALRSFLLWASEHGLHAVDAESIRVALRGWYVGGRRRRTALDAAGRQGEPAAATVGRDHRGGG